MIEAGRISGRIIIGLNLPRPFSRSMTVLNKERSRPRLEKTKLLAPDTLISIIASRRPVLGRLFHSTYTHFFVSTTKRQDLKEMKMLRARHSLQLGAYYLVVT